MDKEKYHWFKHRLYEGFYYPTIGFKYSYINYKTAITYSKYFKWWPFDIMSVLNIKVRLSNPDVKYRREALCLIANNQNEFIIEFNSFNDFGEKIKCFPIDPNLDNDWEMYKQVCSEGFLMVKTSKGSFVGDISDAMWIIKHNLINLAPMVAKDITGRISIGFNLEEQYWTGWGPYGAQAFKIGDAYFDKKATVEECNDLFGLDYKSIDSVPFKYRGKKVCITINDAKKAAINFAKYMRS